MKRVSIDHAPFKKGSKLFEEEGGLNSEVYEVGNRPDFVGKRLKIPEQLDSLPAIRKHVEEDLGSLKQYLGKSLPDFYITYVPYVKEKTLEGLPENKAEAVSAYMFTKKVSKADVRASGDYFEYFRQLNDFLCNVCRMYLATYDETKKWGVSPDINRKNLCFGTTSEDHKARLYLIDLYPTVHEHPDLLADKIEALIKNFLNYNGNFFKETLRLTKQLRAKY